MSREHVETFKRGIDAFHRGDIEALIEVHDPEVETASPISFLMQFTNGKVSWVRIYWGSP